MGIPARPVKDGHDCMKSIYEYMDYREYLKDYYEHQKQNRPAYFSYRYLSRRMGIDSSYLAKVIAKKKHLSIALVPKICSYLKLSDKETHFFSLLLYFAKAKNDKDRNYFFEQVSTSRISSIESFNLREQPLLRKWYFLVVWELLQFKRIPDDPEELVRWMLPTITREEAGEAIALLKEFRFVETQGDGFLRALPKTFLINDTMRTQTIENHKKQVTMLALQALDRFAPEEQIATYAMVSLSEKSLQIMRKRIYALSKKLFKLADCEQENRRVYHFALHGFPATVKDVK